MPISTNHILMIEPAEFYSNEQTAITNVFQDAGSGTEQAIAEHRAFRNRLVDHGVNVIIFKGSIGCPDHLFPNNWVSTHQSGELILYPMLAENRRAERREDIIDFLSHRYGKQVDFTASETNDIFLEGTGSLVLDRQDRVVYACVSPRTDETLVHKWADRMHYKPVIFESRSKDDTLDYHTNVVLFVASGVAAYCPDAIPNQAQREAVFASLSKSHEVLELSIDQVHNFCGNALEVRSVSGKHYLAMSTCAHDHLTDDQKNIISTHLDGIIHSDISTIERLGGGSARCMMLELF